MILINILIMDDGGIHLAVPDGTYDEAESGLRSLLADLQISDIPISQLAPIERHVHTKEEQAIHMTTHTH